MTIQLRTFVSEHAFKRINDVAREYGVEPSTVASRLLEQACGGTPKAPTERRQYVRMTPDRLQTLRRMHEAGRTQADIARATGCSKATIHAHIRKLRRSTP